MTPAAELLPGRLFAIGGTLELNGRQPPISWVPNSARGTLPVCCYALRDGADWMLVDTGLPVHRDAVSAGIAATVATSRRRRVIMTRREGDCMLNLPWILREHAIDEVLYAGALDPLDFFESVASAELEGRLVVSGARRTRRIADGEAVAVGALRLEILRTELRLLATNWLYECETATLFSSDSFSFVLAGAADPFEASNVATFLDAKMDWLRAIDPAPVIADLRALQQSRPIARICPSYGCVIEGADAVARAFDALCAALRLMAGWPRRAALRGFSVAPQS